VEVIDAMSKVMKTELKIRSVPERHRGGERPVLMADNDRLRSLGWRCENDLLSSVEKTLQFYGLAERTG
jgi:UDP-glucose 4-epimerase